MARRKGSLAGLRILEPLQNSGVLIENADSADLGGVKFNSGGHCGNNFVQCCSSFVSHAGSQANECNPRA
jgi:hypothetical protein